MDSLIELVNWMYSFIGASCDMANLIVDRLLLMLRPVIIHSFIPSGASCDMGNLILDRVLLMLRPVFIHSLVDQVVDNTNDLLRLKYSWTNIKMLGGD